MQITHRRSAILETIRSVIGWRDANVQAKKKRASFRWPAFAFD